MNNEKKLCIIQMHYTDIIEHLKEYNAVEKIVSSGLFDTVVIAAADLPENQCLKNWAELWNVEIRFGAIHNVTKRFRSILQEFQADAIVRILPQWYFIDMPLIDKAITALLQSNADYLLYPYDFDIRFGGDIFSHDFIVKTDEHFESNPDLQTKFAFNPWGYADINGEYEGLNFIVYEDIPVFDDTQFRKLKTEFNKIWPEHWDNSDSPQFPYEFAHKFITSGKSVVLDIACGFGTGTKHLHSADPQKVIGVDVSANAIEHCKKKYQNIPNVSFKQGNALSLDFNDTLFDLIVSIHTMEHVSDDNQFLERLKTWLKPEGKIVLEVPLLMKYPFLYSDEPYGDAHIREYYVDDLIDLFSRHFKIVESYGVSRGYYTQLEKARNAVLLVGEQA